jgi:TIR domain
MARIFLSYRPGNASPHALKLQGALEATFGAANVLVGIAPSDGELEPGRTAASDLRTDVLLVLIDADWLHRGRSGQRLIDDPDDAVRLNIEAALSRDIRLIPVLINNAQAPQPLDLPASIRVLGSLPTSRIRHATWKSDFDELANRLRRGDGFTFNIGSQNAANVGGNVVNVGGDMVIGKRSVARSPEQLRHRLRAAARTGVVPASVFEARGAQVVDEGYLPEPEPAPVEPPIPPSSSPPAPHEFDEEYGTYPPKSEPPAEEPEGCQPEPDCEPAPAPEAEDLYPPVPKMSFPPRGDAHARVEASFPRDSRARRFQPWLLVTVPLLLLGAGLVVAKWLLGWFVADVEPQESPGDTVVCTVFAPPSAAPGESILVQAFAHLPEQTDDAAAIARELDLDALRRTFRSLAAPVPVGSRLDFELRMPGLEVDDPVASLVWRRRSEAVQFGVRVPTSAPEGAVIGTLEVSLDSAPIGQIKFKLAIDRHAAQADNEPQGDHARRYTAAFISYASKDREKVLARVQMLSVIGVEYFQDLLSLEPGDRWEKKLELGIDKCDLFLLFWSSEAKESQWVRREVQYALDRRGGDELSPPEIRPVILEGPPIVKPWEELAHLHFNDRLLYFMRPPSDP